MKTVAGAFIVGIIYGSGGVDLPATVLPSIAFILVVYGAMMLWELRHLLPVSTPVPTPKPTTTPAPQPSATYGPTVVLPQTRSSTA
jgi:hypothetical protein